METQTMAVQLLSDAVEHIRRLELALSVRDEKRRQRYARARELAQAIAGRLT